MSAMDLNSAVAGLTCDQLDSVPIADASAIAVSHISPPKIEDIPEASALSAAEETSGVVDSSANTTSLPSCASDNVVSTTVMSDGNLMDHRQSSSNDVSSFILDGPGTDDSFEVPKATKTGNAFPLIVVKTETLQNELEFYEDSTDTDCDSLSGVNDVSAQSSSNLYPSLQNTDDRSAFVCILCDDIFSSFNSITSHLSTSHNVHKAKHSFFFKNVKNECLELFHGEQTVSDGCLSSVKTNVNNTEDVATKIIMKELRVNLVDINVERQLFKPSISKKPCVSNDQISTNFSVDERLIKASISSDRSEALQSDSNTDSYCSVCHISLPDLNEHTIKYHTMGFKCKCCKRVMYSEHGMKAHKRACRRAAFESVDVSRIPCSKNAWDHMRVNLRKSGGNCSIRVKSKKLKYKVRKSNTESACRKIGLGLKIRLKKSGGKLIIKRKPIESKTSADNFCIVCHISLPDLPEHNMKYHTEGKQCEECNAIVFTKGGMKVHTTRIHASRKVSFKPVNTSQVPCVSSALRIIQNSLRKSGGKSSIPPKHTLNKVDKSSVVSSKADYCNVCNITVPNLSEHKLKYHAFGFQCDACNSVVYSDTGMKSHKKKMNSCKNASFTSVDTSQTPCGPFTLRRLKQVRTMARRSFEDKQAQTVARRFFKDKNVASDLIPENFCSVCNILVTDLTQHDVYYHTKGMQCMDCSSVLYTKKGTKIHQAKSHGTQKVAFQSYDTSQLPCNAKELSRIKKLRIERLDAKPSISLKSDPILDKSIDSNVDNFCNVCKINVPNLFEHKRKYHTRGLKCRLCNRLVYSILGMKHHTVKIPACRNAGHIRVNTSLIPCTVSALRYISKKKQKANAKSDRSAYLNTYCSICRRYSPDLPEHNLMYHSQRQKCKICNTVVYSSRGMRTHKTICLNAEFMSVDMSLLPFSKSAQLAEAGDKSSVPHESNKKNKFGGLNSKTFCSICRMRLPDLLQHNIKYHSRGYQCRNCYLVVYCAKGKTRHKMYCKNASYIVVDTSLMPCSKTVNRRIKDQLSNAAWKASDPSKNENKKIKKAKIGVDSSSKLCNVCRLRLPDLPEHNIKYHTNGRQCENCKIVVYSISGWLLHTRRIKACQDATFKFIDTSRIPCGRHIRNIRLRLQESNGKYSVPLQTKKEKMYYDALDSNSTNVCTVCRISLPDLSKHQLKFHTVGNQCGECGAVVRTNRGMKYHQTRIHEFQNVTFQTVKTSQMPCSSKVLDVIRRNLVNSDGKSSFPLGKKRKRKCELVDSKTDKTLDTMFVPCSKKAKIMKSHWKSSADDNSVHPLVTSENTSILKKIAQPSPLSDSYSKLSATASKSVEFNASPESHCNICNLDLPNLTLHKKKYHTTGQVCEICNVITYSEKGMKAHRTRMPNCCNATFKTLDTTSVPCTQAARKSIKAKIMKSHWKSSAVDKSLPPRDPIVTSKTTSILMHCNICYLDLPNLTLHKRKYHTTGQVCEICNVITYSEKGMKTHRTRMPNCCNATFKTLDTTSVPCTQAARRFIKAKIMKSRWKSSAVDKSIHSTFKTTSMLQKTAQQSPKSHIFNKLSATPPRDVEFSTSTESHCNICNLDLPDVAEHKVKYHETGYECDVCGFIGYSEYSMKSHSSRMAACCNATYKTRDTTFVPCSYRLKGYIKFHLIKTGGKSSVFRKFKTTTDPESFCNVCKTAVSDLPKHQIKYHTQAHQCEKCNHIVYSDLGIQRHSKHHRRRKIPFRIVDTSRHPFSWIAVKNTSVHQKVTNQSEVTSANNDVNHDNGELGPTSSDDMGLNTNTQCDVCLINLPDLAEHKNKYHTTGYECDMCSFTAYSERGIKTHMIKSSACCNATFKTVDTSFVQCRRRVKSDIKCNTINSSGKSSVDNVFKTKTNAVLPEICGTKSVCDICKTHVADLPKHQNLYHTQGHQCEKCNRVLYSVLGMKRHLKQKHGCRKIPFRVIDTSLLPYGASVNTSSTVSRCDVCKLYLPDLAHHNIMYHTTGYECQICNVIVYSDLGMQRHIKVRACCTAKFQTVDTTFVPCNRNAKGCIISNLKNSGGNSSVPFSLKNTFKANSTRDMPPAETTANGEIKLEEPVLTDNSFCQVCSCAVKGNIMLHKKYFHSQVYKCKICQKRIYSAMARTRHAVNVHAKRNVVSVHRLFETVESTGKMHVKNPKSKCPESHDSDVSSKIIKMEVS